MLYFRYHRYCAFTTSQYFRTICDSVTGDLLLPATIRVGRSSRRSISNARGSYLLSLQEGDFTQMYTYVGTQLVEN